MNSLECIQVLASSLGSALAFRIVRFSLDEKKSNIPELSPCPPLLEFASSNQLLKSYSFPDLPIGICSLTFSNHTSLTCWTASRRGCA